MAYKDEGRDQGDVSTTEEIPKIVSKLLKAWEKEQNGYFSQPSEGTNSVDPLILRLLASATEDNFLLNHTVCGTLLWQQTNTQG